MNIIAWLVLGIVAGFIASKIVNKSGEGLIRDLILGVIGAVVGGWVMETFGKVRSQRPQHLQRRGGDTGRGCRAGGLPRDPARGLARRGFSEDGGRARKRSSEIAPARVAAVGGLGVAVIAIVISIASFWERWTERRSEVRS